MHKIYILFGFLFIYGTALFAQGPKVMILEEKKGKRLQLFAENKTQDTLNVFLLVNAEGYRRSASKPILKDIPPQKKVLMTTMIELANVESRFTYDLIVNELRDNTIDLHFTEDTRDISSVVKNRLVIFMTPECQKCTALSDALTEKRITHKSFNIHKDRTIYQQFMSFIERSLTEETKIRLPIIWNKDYTIFGYDDLETIVGELEK